MTKSFRKKDGYIYIISNIHFPEYYKLGVTHDIKSRLRTYQTSSPFRDYKIEYYVKHPDCYSAEKKIQENLKYFATDRKKEWFRCSLIMIKNRLDESLVEEENPLTFLKKVI
jgi:hypothetical protein